MSQRPEGTNVPASQEEVVPGVHVLWNSLWSAPIQHTWEARSQPSWLNLQETWPFGLISHASPYLFGATEGENNPGREKKKKRITWRLRCIRKDTAIDEGWEIRTRAEDSPKMPHFVLSRGEDSRHTNEVDWPLWAWIPGWDQQVSEPQRREQRHCFDLFWMGMG